MSRTTSRPPRRRLPPPRPLTGPLLVARLGDAMGEPLELTTAATLRRAGNGHVLFGLYLRGALAAHGVDWGRQPGPRA